MSFNLEENIVQWRSGLRKHRGFEDADIYELEDHLRCKIEEYVAEGSTEEEAFRCAIREDYSDLLTISNQYLSGRAAHSTYLGLLSNYLKVEFRSFGRKRTHFLINLAGLVIGITSVLFIVSYLKFEYSYDKFHTNSDQIYRVNTHFERSTGSLDYPIIPPAIGPAIENNFSGITNTARLRYAYSVLMRHEEKSFYEEKIFFAEPSLLEMFSFKWKIGNPAGALSETNTVVLTQSMAKKYFEDSNPIGEVIKYDNDLDLKVVGVIEDVPLNSHLDFDALVSFETFRPGPGALEPLTSWKWLGFLTYVQIEDVSVVTNIETSLADLFLSNNDSPNNLSVAFDFQPLSDIYLNSGELSNPQGGLFRINNRDNLISLGVIALLILGISFFNYFNITGTLMRTRTREIGVRKVFGASKSKVLTQFALETFSLLTISAVLAVTVFYSFRGNHTIDFVFIGLLCFGIVLFFSLLSSFLLGGSLAVQSALSLLKDKLSESRSTLVSFGDVVLLVQFGISAALIMISFVIVNQLNFFSQKDLGYSKEGLIIARYGSEEMNAKRDIFKHAMNELSSIEGVSFGPALDGHVSGSPLRLSEWPDEQVIQTSYFGVDYDFQNTLGLEVLEGRFFSREIPRDSVSSLLINETLASMLGLENPVGARVQFTSGEFEIIGIFKDFHYQSLHHEIGPMALEMWLGQPRNVMIRYKSEDIAGTLGDIESAWNEVFADGGFPLDYRFLDEQLASMYDKESEYVQLLEVFTGLAIFLSLLGLFGVSSLSIQQGMRQIGIRRILGADFTQIARAITSRYMITAVAGVVLFLPLAYLAMEKWLSDYAYSISMDLRYPLFTLGIVLLVTTSILTFQVYRVMHVNPTSILRDE